MAVNSIIYVFHLRKPDGTCRYFHPFEEFDKLISKGGTFKIEGCYGDEPVIESLTAFRNQLYTIIEESVDSWIMESRFIPRFISSAAVFLLVYFFLSFAVRDPLPMIDEIAAGIAAASLFYVYLGRKYKKTGSASKLRSHYRGIIDRIVFSESRFVLAVESLLERLEGEGVGDIVGAVINSQELPVILDDENRMQRSQFISYIERGIKKEFPSPRKKIINRIIRGSLENSVESLKQLDMTGFSGEIDFSLLVVYLAVKEGKTQKVPADRGSIVD